MTNLFFFYSLKLQHFLKTTYALFMEIWPGIVWGLQQPNCQSPELSAEHPDGYICSSGYPIPHAHRLFLHLLEHCIYQPTQHWAIEAAPAGENVVCLQSLTGKMAYKSTLLEPPICRSYLIGSSRGSLLLMSSLECTLSIQSQVSLQLSHWRLPWSTRGPFFDGAGENCKYHCSVHNRCSVSEWLLKPCSQQAAVLSPS